MLTSAGPVVVVDDSAEDVCAFHLRADGGGRGRDRLFELQAPVGSGPVVVLDVLGEDCLQVALGHDEQVVEAVLSHGAHPTLGERVGPRAAHWILDSFDPDRGEHGVEADGELGVAVLYEEPKAMARGFELGREKLRATWVTHPWLELAVTPRTCRTRRSISITKST